MGRRGASCGWAARWRQPANRRGPLHRPVQAAHALCGGCPPGPVFAQWMKDRMLVEKAWQLEAVDRLKPIADGLECS